MDKWEIDYIKKFGTFGGTYIYENIKAFISQTLKQQAREIIGKIEKQSMNSTNIISENYLDQLKKEYL